MPALTVTSGTESTCTSCMDFLEYLALKCRTCSGYTHLRCSELPEYQIVRLAVTQASYVCSACVKSNEIAEERYDTELEKVKDIVSKEKLAVEMAKKSSQDDTVDYLLLEFRTQNGEAIINEAASRSTVETATVTESGSSGEIASGSNATRLNDSVRTPNDTPVCQDYLQKKCRYGKSGKVNGTCSNRHPRFCIKFLKFGKLQNGCKLGKNCRFYHPRLCWQFTKRKECGRDNCEFYHNSQMVKPIRKTNSPSQNDARQKFNPRTPGRREQMSKRPSTMGGRPQEGVVPQRAAIRDDGNFLAVQNQLQAQISQMQQTLQILLMRDKSSDHQRSTMCRCGQPSY